MGLFAPKPEAPTAPAPAKRKRKDVTRTELGDAISAVYAEMGDCSASQTLEALYILTLTDNAGGAGGAEGDDIVRLDGPAPVTVAKFDDALAQMPDNLPPGILSPLTRVRALLAQAEEKAAAVDSEPVTRAEFNALVDAVADVVDNIDAARGRQGYPDGRLDRRLKDIVEASKESPRQSMLQRILDQAQVAHKNNDEREREKARRRPGQPWSTM